MKTLLQWCRVGPQSIKQVTKSRKKKFLKRGTWEVLEAKISQVRLETRDIADHVMWCLSFKQLSHASRLKRELWHLRFLRNKYCHAIIWMKAVKVDGLCSMAILQKMDTSLQRSVVLIKQQPKAQLVQHTSLAHQLLKLRNHISSKLLKFKTLSLNKKSKKKSYEMELLWANLEPHIDFTNISLECLSMSPTQQCLSNRPKWI